MNRCGWCDKTPVAGDIFCAEHGRLADGARAAAGDLDQAVTYLRTRAQGLTDAELRQLCAEVIADYGLSDSPDQLKARVRPPVFHGFGAVARVEVA